MSRPDDTRPDAARWPSPFDSFAPGDLLGGRYRVLRPLGRGAMGEVYAVRDSELASDVALKLLRPAAPADADARERFKREILLARRVSHPNVCRIFDFGMHTVEGPAGAALGPLLFLTMELLDGETLVARIERDGPFAESAAIAIARQLAAALAAAHRVGVVHRDFKSANVMLVGGAEPRAVVTDFGLARETVSDPGGRALTLTGGVLGTPAYMAPEQVEGARADARSDLYALGVVLYEMLTARFPFDGDSPLAVALKRLQEPPVPPEVHRPDLSLRLRELLRRTLARQPAARFASAEELLRALDDGASPGAATRRSALPLAAAAVAVAAAGGWWALRPSPPAETPPAAVRAARPAVAVLPLRNAAGRGEEAWLATALAEMLSSELAAGDALRTVPGETVARAARDLALGPSESLAPETLGRLRGVLGADVVLSGSFVALGEPGRGPLRLDLRLQFADGRPDLPRRAEGSAEALFALVATAGAELRAALGVDGAPGAATGGAVATAQPRGERAQRAYALGLERLRAGEPAAAREQFELALAEDGESPLVWSALSEAWSLTGWEGRALDAARQAFERRAVLPRAEALAVEGRYRLANREWEAAIDIQHALWRLYGDDPEHGLRLVHALLEADRGADADRVLAELRVLPPPARDDPRIDLYEARSADGLSEPRRQLAAAERAEAKATTAGARSLVARALYEQGLARRKLGEPVAARAALERSRAIAGELGDRSAAAVALWALANQARAEGRLGEAAALFGEARATFAALGHRGREARAELSQGLVVSQQGDLGAALGLYERALAKLREVDDRRGAAAALANIGTLLYERGDLAAAEARHAEALAEFRALGDDSRVAIALQNLAQIRLDRGDLAGAERDLGEELAIARRSEDKTVEGYALKAMGDLATERGDLAAAGERLDQASRAFETAGQATWKLYAEMARAVLARESGRAAASAEALASIAAALGRDGLANDRDEAELQRVRALVAAGDTGTAESVAAELVPRAATSDVARLRLLARWTAAELAAARGDRAGADRLLAEQQAQAERSGLVLVALEAAVRRAVLGLDPALNARRAALRDEAEGMGAGRVGRLLEGR